MKIPELLAPVGSREALIAAVQNGANAVYLGGKLFSARQYANNFDREEMQQAFDYAHYRNVKVYVTVNTLLHNNEFGEAVEYLGFLYEAGADAVIIQDLGVAGVIRRMFPNLALHASTQMTVHNSAGVKALQNHGFSRIVLAREVSLRDITTIKKETGADLEVFVHGALCVSYSGQCLMSSMIGGRSGNRGRCAQPCRMEYSLVDEKDNPVVDRQLVGSHLLSPRDLNMVRHIPELAEAGIASLKIEGRMKRPEYVAIVTKIYREALDRYMENPDKYQVDDRELKDLAQIFNRGFTTGYFFGKQGPEMMSYKRPNNRGLRLGRVTQSNWSEKTVEIMLEDELRLGDGVEFWVTDGGRQGSVVNWMTVDGKSIEKAQKGQKVWIQSEGKIRPGDRVFKTHDIQLISAAEQSYKSSREVRKTPLNFIVSANIGQPLKITVTDPNDHSFSTQSSYIGQEARNKPLTLDALQKQLDRLGNTPFSMGKLTADIGENIMVPASEINELRRMAVEGIMEGRLAAYKSAERVKQGHDLVPPPITHSQSGNGSQQGQKLMLSVHTKSLSVLKTAVNGGADIIYFGGSNLKQQGNIAEFTEALNYCKTKGVQMGIATPRIVGESEMSQILPIIEFAKANTLPVLAASLGVLEVAKQAGVPRIMADFPLNIYNYFSVRWLVENFAITQATLSPELTLGQITDVTRRTPVPVEALVQGHLPLMTTEYCPEGSLIGESPSSENCHGSCRKGHSYGLKDRMGLVFPLMHDEFCRTYLLNAKELSMIEDIEPLFKAGISVFRVEISVENINRVSAIISLWRRELDNFMRQPSEYQADPDSKEKIHTMSPAGLTKGHYYRGVE